MKKKVSKKETYKTKLINFYKINILKIIYGLLILIILSTCLCLAVNVLLSYYNIKIPIDNTLRIIQEQKAKPKLESKVEPNSQSKSESESEAKDEAKKEVKAVPAFEIFPKEKIIHIKPELLKKISKRPKIALIIDDLGYNKNLADKFLNLNVKLTFSILPFSPFLDDIVTKAHKKGIEIMLHLPMEPIEYPNISPGPYALLTSMTPNQLIKQLNSNLDAVPLIKGVNNHMGSKMTMVSNQMYQIFSVLKKQNLYFIDSRTTNKSLCKPSARLLKIPFAERDIFLDHTQTQESIEKQIKRLYYIASKVGAAIGIGHPHSLTYKVLKKDLPNLSKKVNFVYASQIVSVVD